MSGIIYDKDEANKMTAFLNQQDEQFKALETEKEVSQKMILKYSILVVGAVGVLFALNFILSKKVKK